MHLSATKGLFNCPVCFIVIVNYATEKLEHVGWINRPSSMTVILWFQRSEQGTKNLKVMQNENFLPSLHCFLKRGVEYLERKSR